MVVKDFIRQLQKMNENEFIVCNYFTKDDVIGELDMFNYNNETAVNLTDEQLNDILLDFDFCETLNTDILYECVVDYIEKLSVNE